jgi:hypothetical protein
MVQWLKEPWSSENSPDQDFGINNKWPIKIKTKMLIKSDREC